MKAVAWGKERRRGLDRGRDNAGRRELSRWMIEARLAFGRSDFEAGIGANSTRRVRAMGGGAASSVELPLSLLGLLARESSRLGV